MIFSIESSKITKKHEIIQLNVNYSIESFRIRQEKHEIVQWNVINYSMESLDAGNKEDMSGFSTNSCSIESNKGVAYEIGVELDSLLILSSIYLALLRGLVNLSYAFVSEC